jgi:hypothetical protein
MPLEEGTEQNSIFEDVVRDQLSDIVAKVGELQECYAMHFSTEAARYFTEWQRMREIEWTASNDGFCMQIYSRLAPTVTKLGMLFELGSPDFDVTNPIRLEFIQEACRLVDTYFMPTARAVYDLVGSNVEKNVIDRIAAYLKNHNGKATKKEIMRDIKIKSADFNEYLATMIESGTVECNTVKNSGKGRDSLWVFLLPQSKVGNVAKVEKIAKVAKVDRIHSVDMDGNGSTLATLATMATLPTVATIEGKSPSTSLTVEGMNVDLTPNTNGEASIRFGDTKPVFVDRRHIPEPDKSIIRDQMIDQKMKRLGSFKLMNLIFDGDKIPLDRARKYVQDAESLGLIKKDGDMYQWIGKEQKTITLRFLEDIAEYKKDEVACIGDDKAYGFLTMSNPRVCELVLAQEDRERFHKALKSLVKEYPFGEVQRKGVTIDDVANQSNLTKTEVAALLEADDWMPKSMKDGTQIWFKPIRNLFSKIGASKCHLFAGVKSDLTSGYTVQTVDDLFGTSIGGKTGQLEHFRYGAEA